VLGLAALTLLPDGGANESGKRKRRFSLRRKKVKWAGRGGPALPIMMVGTNPPWSSLISAGWRQGLVVERGVLGEEEEKI
jgi:hypothetical protein